MLDNMLILSLLEKKLFYLLCGPKIHSRPKHVVQTNFMLTGLMWQYVKLPFVSIIEAESCFFRAHQQGNWLSTEAGNFLCFTILLLVQSDVKGLDRFLETIPI